MKCCSNGSGSAQREVSHPLWIEIEYLLSQCYDALCRRSPFLSARNVHSFFCLGGRRMNAWVGRWKKICLSSVSFVASRRHKMYSCRKPLHWKWPLYWEIVSNRFTFVFFYSLSPISLKYFNWITFKCIWMETIAVWHPISQNQLAMGWENSLGWLLWIAIRMQYYSTHSLAQVNVKQ